MTSRYHLDEILAKIHHYQPFLTGITVSGGEATLQLPFIQNLFTAIKQHPQLAHLTCLIDSNGYLAQHGWQKVITVMDGAMIDLKAWNNDIHLRLTGRGNQRVKETIRYLAEHNKLSEVRLLLIPEQTDLADNAKNIAEFLGSLSSNLPIRINAFHSHGVKGIAKTWASATKDQVEEFATELRKYGLTQITLPNVYL